MLQFAPLVLEELRDVVDEEDLAVLSVELDAPDVNFDYFVSLFEAILIIRRLSTATLAALVVTEQRWHSFKVSHEVLI